MRKSGKKPAGDSMHKRAETLLKNKAGDHEIPEPDADIHKLIHELEIYKVELKLQNEELKRAIVQSEKISKKYAGLYDFSPTGYLTISRDGTILELNQCASKMLGKAVDSLIGSQFGFFISLETRSVYNMFLHDVCSGKGKKSCRVTLSVDGKALRFLHMNGIRTNEQDQCLITIDDITAWTNSHNALEKTRDRYRLLAEHMSDIVWMMDMNFRVIFQSPSSRALRGFSLKQLREMPLEKSMTSESLKIALEVFETEFPKILANPGYNPVHKLELEYYCRNGNTVWMENKFSFIRDDQGNPISILGEGRDITQRRKADYNLRKSYSLLDATLESIHNGILVVDTDGKVIKTNTTFVKMWHIPDEVIRSGEDARLLKHVLGQLSDPDEFIRKVNELYEKREQSTVDLIHFKDGRVFERISNPMYITGIPEGRVWSFLDITERTKTEAEIISKNEELTQANAEKDKFFSIIAHDLRSPFNGFLGLTQLLAEDLETMTIREIGEVVLILKNSARNLFTLLENLLEWSMLRRGVTTFNPVWLNPDVMAEKCLGTVTELLGKKEIEVRLDIQANTAVFADDYMLGSALRNLVTNAIKFTPRGGKIVIGVRRPSDNFSEIFVQDNGIGISEKMAERLFTIGEPTSRKGTEGEPSSGLGLIICREFIEKHQGKLWVESEVDKGSTFYILLPVPDKSNPG